MARIIRTTKGYLLLGAALVLAAGTGLLAATALGTGTQTPTRTVTISVENGATGPTGPAGPKGDPGAESCPAGSQFGELVINAPSGHVSILTCIKD